MSMFFAVFAFLYKLPSEIPLSCDRLESAMKLEAWGSFLFVVDYKSCKVHKFDLRGQCLGEFCSRGQGPGEVIKMTDFGRHGEGFYILDAGSRKVIFFDSDMKLQKEVRLDASMDLRAALFVAEDLWVFGFQPQNKQSIHVLDAETGKLKRSFGGSIDKFFQPRPGPEQFGFYLKYGAATLALHEHVVYVTWQFGFAVEMYKENGAFIKAIAIPGLEQERIFDANNQRILYEARFSGFFEKDQLLLSLAPGPYVPDEQLITYSYLYDLATGVWWANRDVLDFRQQGGSWYRIQRDENDNFLLKLTSKPAWSFKKWPLD